ncbi:MAG: hypothetical protein HC932_01085 [Thermales bacterium]|nr:hypothetical protein [Thermales bacterium]
MLTHKNLQVWYFKNQPEYEKWLSKNHDNSIYQEVPKGVWVRLYKKASGVPTLSKDDLIDTSICWGWIDGLINSYDEQSYLYKVTPRGSKSVWSQVNVAKVKN